MSVSVIEARAKKLDLERAILKLIDDFQDEAGVQVLGISLQCSKIRNTEGQICATACYNCDVEVTL